MNEFLNINYSEKIVAFLDGELDASERESLFLTMASSPQLQEEMRQQIIISQTLKKSLLVPPETLKHNIFAAIGATSVVAPNAQKSFYSKILNKKLTLILSLFLLLIVPFVYYQFFDNNQLKDNIAHSSNPSKFDLPKEIPLTSSFSDNHQVLSKHTTKSNSSQVPSNTSTKLNVVAPQADELSKIDEIQTYLSSDNTLFFIDASNSVEPDLNLLFNNNKRFSQIFENAFTKTDFLDKLSMQIRFFEAKNFVNSNIKPVSNPLLNNFGFAIIYDIDNNNSVAIELGQEDFVQKFKGELNEFPSLIKQNYTAFWAGASFQYTFEDYNFISPFVRGMIGGTRIGPLSKIIIGGKYYLSNKIYAFVGIENTALFYEFQNKWFSSFKSGLAGGVSIKF